LTRAALPQADCSDGAKRLVPEGDSNLPMMDSFSPPAGIADSPHLCYNDHRLAKSIEASIDFAAKRQVWQRMIQGIICPMLIAMNLWQNSRAVLLRRKAARRKAFWLFTII